MLFLFRTGSAPVLIVISFVLTMFFLGCSNSSKNELAVFKALDESLTNSNRTINKSSEVILASLKDKTTDPVTADHANLWYPRALAIKEETANTFYYIEEIKKLLKKETGLDSSRKAFKEDDKKAVLNLFVTKKKGKELDSKLKNYANYVLSLDADLGAVFAEELARLTQSFDTASAKKDLTTTFFKEIPTGAAIAVLSKFQNNLKVSENNLIQFCNNKVGAFVEVYETYSAIVGQSSTYVRSGEVIEITAGVGAFSRAGKPTITFDGIEVALDESGTASYKFKAPGRAGKQIVPVEISYIDQEGKKQVITKDVEYTVAKEMYKKE